MICGERIAIVMPSIWTWASRGSIEPEKSRPVTMLASVQTSSAYASRPANKAQANSRRAIGRRTTHSIRPDPGGRQADCERGCDYSRPVLQPIGSYRRLDVHRDLRDELEGEHLHQRLRLVGGEHECGAAADHLLAIIVQHRRIAAHHHAVDGAALREQVGPCALRILADIVLTVADDVDDGAIAGERRLAEHIRRMIDRAVVNI